MANLNTAGSEKIVGIEKTMQTEADAYLDTPEIQAAIQPFSIWFSNAGRVQAQAARFIASRFAKDLQIPAQIAACRSPGDLMRLQLKFAKEITDDYLLAQRKMLELIGAEFEDAASGLT